MEKQDVSSDEYKEDPEQIEAQRVARPIVPELDEILGVPLKVLDDGFVRLVDYMGSDESIVQAARVSYGKGTRKVSQDRGLIRYLMRHRHTTPFEMAEIKLHVRVPMDCWRQWIRHRTACLAEGTDIYFDLPGGIERRGNQLYKLKIEDLWARSQPTQNARGKSKQRNPFFRRDRIQDMRLRQINEDSLRIQHTNVVDVFRNGEKPVFRITLGDGKTIEATADHRFLFNNGWRTLKEETGLHERAGKAVWTRGDYRLFVNGMDVQIPVDRGGQRTVTYGRLQRIAKIEYVGGKMTYDIEVEGPFHNFIANGIVTHNSVNEYSTRYSIAIDGAQQTKPDEWRLQSSVNKQGSEDHVSGAHGERLSTEESELLDRSRKIYQERLDAGVAREQARKDLPLSTYTEAYWKIDLHNMFHFLSLRMDAHAQQEIRDYATTIGHEIVRRWCPIAWEAFLDYRMQTMNFTRLDMEIVAAIGQGNTGKATAVATEFGWLKRGEKGLLRNRERSELESKLERLNLPIPWRD